MIPFEASIPYFIFFFFLFLAMFYKGIKSSLQIYGMNVFSLFLLLLFYRGRYSDWSIYKKMTENYFVDGTFFEWGFDFLTRIAASSVGFILLPIIGLIIYLFMLDSYRRYISDKNQFLLLSISFLYAFLPLFLGALRQCMSFSLMLYAILQFHKKSYMRGIIALVVSFLLHRSSVPILVFYLIYYLDFRIFKKHFFLFMISLVVSYLIGQVILGSVDQLIVLLNFENSLYAGTAESESVSSLKALLLPAERLIIALMSLFVLYHSKDHPFYRIFPLLAISGGIFYLSLYKFSLNAAGRTTAFFRLADFWVVYSFIKLFFNIKRKDIRDTFWQSGLNSIAILGSSLYSLIKYYFTIVSAGLFR